MQIESVFIRNYTIGNFFSRPEQAVTWFFSFSSSLKSFANQRQSLQERQSLCLKIQKRKKQQPFYERSFVVTSGRRWPKSKWWSTNNNNKTTICICLFIWLFHVYRTRHVSYWMGHIRTRTYSLDLCMDLCVYIFYERLHRLPEHKNHMTILVVFLWTASCYVE